MIEILSGNIKKMASFDFNIAMKLEELTSTNIKKVNDFLTVIEFYHDTLTITDQTKLIKFIVSVKIRGEAKVRLGVGINTLETLKEAALTKIVALESLEVLQQQLLNCRQ